ncbi:MAG: RsmB/NOP family class I SAM-dependent RNA methyltransferase [Thermoproteota archaeon]|nr:RsmB/NOP family class I SAM-dependent RNA methyltransferase [Thermoproteota archaeon]
MTLIFPESVKSASLAAKYGYDEWLVSRFLQYVPDVNKFLLKMEMPPTQYIRVNTLKTSREELEGRLRSKGFELKSTIIPEVLAVHKAPLPIGATTEYLLGHYYIQDLGSCIAVEALDIAEGQAVLDIAAAPGGKTTLIAQKMNNTGAIIALEPNGRRARSMSFNVTRCGVYNTSIFRMNGLEAHKFEMKFDRVLLDAPCSCEGVIAKDVTRKTSHTPQDVDYCSQMQEKLIEVAARCVKPSGILLYSTCSFAPEENEMVIDRLLQKSENVTVEPLRLSSSRGLTKFGDWKFDGQLKNATRLYPHIDDTTGFFITRLRIN